MARSGFATVLALACLLIASVLAVHIARLTGSDAAGRNLLQQRLTSDNLVSDAEHLACAWLSRHADSLALPPASGILVLVDHAWTGDDGLPWHLGIALIDHASLLPRAALTMGHPLRLATARSHAAPYVIGNLPNDPDAVLDSAILPAGWQHFPARWPTGQQPGALLQAQELGPRIPLVTAFECDGISIISANTAPESLLRLVCRDSTIDVDAIIAQRRDGRMWRGQTHELVDGLRLVPSSRRWSVFIHSTAAGRTAARYTVLDGGSGPFTPMRRYHVTPSSAPSISP